MSVADKTIDELYTLKSKVSTADKAVEAYVVSRNPALVTAADEALAGIPVEPVPPSGDTAEVQDGETIAVLVHGEYTDSVMFTVVGGVITSITLS